MTQVAIIGSGPTALFAALAVEHAGHDPIIFAKGDKSAMFGAMYLHEGIPGVHQHNLVPEFGIDIIKVGSREGYAYNVYGDRGAPCSWDVISEGLAPAWNLASAYDLVWERYAPRIQRREVTKENLGTLVHNFPLVLNSAPASAFCAQGHSFASQPIWVIHGPTINPIEGVNDGDMMYYNGIPHDGSFRSTPEDDIDSDEEHTYMKGHDWYRFSQIGGYQAWEYSHEPLYERDNPRTLSTGAKPLTNDCWCWLSWPGYKRIGRYGKWEKGVLTHHAYREASGACRAL